MTPKTYKPPMSLMVFVTFFCTVVVAGFGILVFYRPSFSGTYEGYAEDLPAGVKGKLALAIKESDGKLTGTVLLPPGMQPQECTLVGVKNEKNIVFVTTDTNGGKMTWSGLYGRDFLDGSYWWGEVDENARSVKPPLGRWEAIR